MKSEQTKLDLAVIGCGGFSKFFIPLFSVHPQVARVRVCDTVRERAENYAAQFGVEIIDRFEEVLQSKEVNAVAIFTPRHTHGDLVVRALDAGKHVYQNGGYSPIQEERASSLPDSFKAMNGQTLHMGTHLFLVDDFCRCVAEHKMPYVNAWRAARYTIPGIIAHDSAMAGGIPLDVPDFGDAPDEL